MKNLNLLFDFLLFPFVFLMRFVLSQNQDEHSHRGLGKREIFYALLFQLFLMGAFATSLQAGGTDVTCTACPNTSSCNSKSKCEGYSSCTWENGGMLSDDECRNTVCDDFSSESECDGSPVGCHWVDRSFPLSDSCEDGALNHAPVANAGSDQTITVGEDVTLDGNGSTDDGAIDNYAWDDGQGHTATGATPTISGLGQGSYTFTLTVTDNDNATDTDTVTITVSAVASSMEAKDNFYTTAFETAVSGNVITDNPADVGNGLSVSVHTNPVIKDTSTSTGSLSINTDGSFTFTPGNSFDGNVTFTYTISDGGVIPDTDTATVYITVNPSGGVPNYQNEYACGVFGSVLSTYNHLYSYGTNDQACNTENIAYPEGEITGGITCHLDPACADTGKSCDRVDPPTNKYGHNFPVNSKSGTTESSPPTTLVDLEYGDITGGSYHFDPQHTYSDNPTKIMLLGDMSVGGGSTLRFEPGDYYFDSLEIKANNNDIILPNGGQVRIFVKGDLSVAMNNLHFNSTGHEDNLFVYVNGDFNSLGNGGGTTNWKAYMYVEGNVLLKNNSNNWKIYGGITAEGSITIDGNNPDFLKTGDGGGSGLGACQMCYDPPRGSNGINFFSIMSFCTPFTPCDLYVPVRNISPVPLDDVQVIEAQQSLFSMSWGSNYEVVDQDDVQVPGTSASKSSNLYTDLPMGFNMGLGNGYITYNAGDDYPTYAYDPDREYYQMHKKITFSMNILDFSRLIYFGKYVDDANRSYNVQLNMCEEPQPVLTAYLSGPFDAWDVFRGDTNSDGFIDDKNISTKIASKDFDLIIASLDKSATHIQTKMGENSAVQFAIYNSEGTRIDDAASQSSFDANATDSVQVTFNVGHATRSAHVGYRFCATYRYEATLGDNIYILKPTAECTNTINDACDEETEDTPTWHVCYNTDVFAVRPKEFDITTVEDTELLKSAVPYNFTVTAEDETAVPTDDYNQTKSNLQLYQRLILNDGTEDNASNPKLNGTLTYGSSDFAFDDGISADASGNHEVVGVSFNDVAKVTIGFRDTDWASVDTDDTPSDCTGGLFSNGLTNLTVPEGMSICGEENTKFIPHHFKVDNIHLRNHKDGNFTYLSNDLNMSAHIDVDISAVNANNVITQNFKQGSLYYENPVSVDLNVTDWNASSSNKHPLGNAVIVKDIPTASNLGFGGSDANGTHGIAWNDSNATQQLMFNYTRQNQQAVNPFDINGTDINITVTSRYPVTGTTTAGNTADINGSGIGDRNATFQFARAKSSQPFYNDTTTNSRNTPISVVVYCDKWPASATNCPNVDLSLQSSEAYWWRSSGHNENSGDGNITLQVGTITPSGSAHVDTDVSILSDGTDSSIDVTRDSGSLPMTVDIDLDTSNPTDTNSWIIYNKDFDSIPSPFYQVRFIGTSLGWTGYGKTGHVVGDDINKKKTRRLEW